MVKKKDFKYSCEEHVDEMIDIFLDEGNEMPIMVESKNDVCDACDRVAMYGFYGSDVKGEWE